MTILRVSGLQVSGFEICAVRAAECDLCYGSSAAPKTAAPILSFVRQQKKCRVTSNPLILFAYVGDANSASERLFQIRSVFSGVFPPRERRERQQISPEV